MSLCTLPSACMDQRRLPTMSKVVYVCMRKCFRCSPVVSPSPWTQKRRHQSFLLLQLSFQCVCHKCQGMQWCGYTQGAFLRKRGSRNRGAGATVWRSLTNLSPVNTRSHSPADTQTGTFPAVEACFQVSNLSGSFLLLQTLNVFKMYVKITQYGHNNLHHGHNNLHHH